MNYLILLYFVVGIWYCLTITHGTFKPTETPMARVIAFVIISVSWPIIFLSRFLSVW